MVSFVTYAWSHSPRLLLHRKLWWSISPSAQLNGSTNWFWRLTAQSLANRQLCWENEVCCEVWENTYQSRANKYSGHFPSAFNLKSVLAFCDITSKWRICMYIMCVFQKRGQSLIALLLLKKDQSHWHPSHSFSVWNDVGVSNDSATLRKDNIMVISTLTQLLMGIN